MKNYIRHMLFVIGLVQLMPAQAGTTTGTIGGAEFFTINGMIISMPSNVSVIKNPASNVTSAL